jgi:hypothetical protein
MFGIPSKCTIIAMALMMATVAFAGSTLQIKLKDGSTWRGNVNDSVELVFIEQGVQRTISGRVVKADEHYLKVETTIAGTLQEKVIFRTDVVHMKTLTGDAAIPAKATESKAADRQSTVSVDSTKDVATEGQAQCVFVLPLRGGVGSTFRHEEIEMMGKEADKHGPGQIIVLLVDSDGGSAYESQLIAETIFNIRNRHRVVAWVHKAISAGCQTAMCCSEIYFMTEGTAGSVTTWNPGTGQSIKGEELQKSMEHLAEIAERAGHNGGRWIAYAMKTNTAMVSYDKDPVTGKVTFYNDLSGEKILSDANSNLCFNATNALDCGFSDGTADTEEDLARLLNLPKWCEVSDYGRRIAKQWEQTVEKAQEEIPLLAARYNYKGTGSGDAVEVLGTRIGIIQDLIRWHDRCPNVAQQMIPPKGQLERELSELRKQLADLKKRTAGQ